MPHYEFFCQDCQEFFDKTLALADYEGGEVPCPHCGSKNVEQPDLLSLLLRRRKVRDMHSPRSSLMRFDKFSFGSIQIDGSTYEHDVVIDRGEISKRKKKPSKKFRQEFGHTPLSIQEKIPWKCQQLVIGTGAHGNLPVMPEVQREAERRKVKLLALPTLEALKVLERVPERYERDPSRDVLRSAGVEVAPKRTTDRHSFQ
jgi:putative FmdB family regulatory protein